MKFGSATIGTILFTAIGTAAFVWMAKRPAVDSTAMSFGMPNTSQVSASTSNSSDNTTTSTSNAENTPAESAEKEPSSPAPTANEDEATTTNNNSATDSSPANENTVAPTTTDNAPASNSVENNTTSIPAETPVPENMEESVVETPVVEKITPPSQLAPSQPAPVETIPSPTIDVAPSTTNTAPTTIESPIELSKPIPPAPTETNSNIVPQTQTIDENKTATTDSSSEKPKTVKIRTDKIFGDSLPSYIRDQLPEMIDIPIDQLLEQSAQPAE